MLIQKCSLECMNKMLLNEDEMWVVNSNHNDIDYLCDRDRYLNVGHFLRDLSLFDHSICDFSLFDDFDHF